MSDIVLRPVDPAEAAMIHGWRNHADVRQYSRHSGEIPLADHVAWLTTALADPAMSLLMAMADERPVGVVRFDYGASIATISLYLAPDLIGKGLGRKVLSGAGRWLTGNRPDIVTIRATILPENIRSQKTFLAVGYVQKNNYFDLDVSS